MRHCIWWQIRTGGQADFVNFLLRKFEEKGFMRLEVDTAGGIEFVRGANFFDGLTIRDMGFVALRESTIFRFRSFRRKITSRSGLGFGTSPEDPSRKFFV